MTNKWIISFAYITTVITSIFFISEAKEIRQIEAPCLQCHDDLNDVLPFNHSIVEGRVFTICVTCHVPNPPDESVSNPFSAHLHLIHQQPHHETDCMLCHTYDPGKNFGLHGLDISYGSPSSETMDRIREVFSSWANSPFLDSLHSKKDITCSGCHGINLFTGGKGSVTDRCISCHPGYIMTPDEISSISLAEIDPHKSHQGNLDCTICHKSHEASVVYCLKCHGDLKIKIPGSAALPVSKVREYKKFLNSFLRPYRTTTQIT